MHTALGHWSKDLIFDLGCKYCIGRTLLLLLHSSLGVTGTKWQDEWGRVGASEEDRMEGGGGRGAEVMRAAHATTPRCCVPLREARWEDGNMGGGVRYYLLLLDMAY